ncbi:MAG: Uma2 family endonuclease [Acetobacteraceae bacterium]|nr:Uma2 family endonuclease [Acetobacteraceae bacterium]
MSASLKIPSPSVPGTMTVPEFLEWCPDDGQRWELVDGTPRAMAPAKIRYGALQSELARLLGNHLAERDSPCRVIIAPGVIPRVQAASNVRVPDLAVTCTPFDATDGHLTDPVLIVEILSPSNHADTWANVWAYASIPSVREILVLRTVTMRADLLRRNADGTWPEGPELITEGALTLASIGFAAPLAAFYRTAEMPPPA